MEKIREESSKAVISEPRRPLTKAEKVEETVHNNMLIAMGCGLIPLPVYDNLAISSVQLKMLAELCSEYGIEFKKNWGKAVIATLLSSLSVDVLGRGIVRSFFKLIPFVGPIAGGLSMSLSAGATTFAIGKVFAQHFESGGTFLNFDAKKMKANFSDEFHKGITTVKKFGR